MPELKTMHCCLSRNKNCRNMPILDLWQSTVPITYIQYNNANTETVSNLLNITVYKPGPLLFETDPDPQSVFLVSNPNPWANLWYGFGSRKTILLKDKLIPVPTPHLLPKWVMFSVFFISRICCLFGSGSVKIIRNGRIRLCSTAY